MIACNSPRELSVDPVSSHLGGLKNVHIEWVLIIGVCNSIGGSGAPDPRGGGQKNMWVCGRSGAWFGEYYGYMHYCTLHDFKHYYSCEMLNNNHKLQNKTSHNNKHTPPPTFNENKNTVVTT